jgi:DNA-binding transcriptional LysR family regulator
MLRIGDRGEMEALVRSVELGSFSAAARELKLTPSAISKLVTRLESTLEVRLLHRTTRHIQPTAEGDLFVQRCRTILGEMDAAEAELGRTRERPKGRLRMSIGVGFGMHQVVPELPRFLEQFPDVELDLVIDDRRADLIRENFDITVQPWPSDGGEFVVRKLFEYERITCASPAYLKRFGVPRSPGDLARHRCMGVSSVPNNMRWQFQMPTGSRAIEVVPNFSANNVDCVYRFALYGLGIVRLAEYITAEAISDGRLVKVLSGHAYAERLTMLALYRHERYRLPRVAAMLEFLATTFAGRPWRNTKR